MCWNSKSPEPLRPHNNWFFEFIIGYAASLLASFTGRAVEAMLNHPACAEAIHKFVEIWTS